MSLNTVTELKDILEVPGEVTNASLQAFLDDANIFVSEDLAAKGFTSTRLKAIEKYIAAHLAIQYIERGGLVSSQTGLARDTYTSLSPLGNANIGGFQLTRYGQQAITLDTSKTLLGMSTSTLKAKFRVLSDQIPTRPVYGPDCP